MRSAEADGDSKVWKKDQIRFKWYEAESSTMRSDEADGIDRVILAKKIPFHLVMNNFTNRSVRFPGLRV